MQDQQTNSVLLSFLRERLGLLPANLSVHSSIEQTFEIIGLDTEVLYENFIEKFNVVVPEDYVGDHISSENLDLGDLFNASSPKAIESATSTTTLRLVIWKG